MSDVRTGTSLDKEQEDGVKLEQQRKWKGREGSERLRSMAVLFLHPPTTYPALPHGLSLQGAPDLECQWTEAGLGKVIRAWDSQGFSEPGSQPYLRVWIPGVL